MSNFENIRKLLFGHFTCIFLVYFTIHSHKRKKENMYAPPTPQCTARNNILISPFLSGSNRPKLYINQRLVTSSKINISDMECAREILIIKYCLQLNANLVSCTVCWNWLDSASEMEIAATSMVVSKYTSMSVLLPSLLLPLWLAFVAQAPWRHITHRNKSSGRSI